MAVEEPTHEPPVSGSHDCLNRVLRIVNRWHLARERQNNKLAATGRLPSVPLTGQPVVTVSSQCGTRGQEIARILATVLRYGYVDPNLVAFVVRHMAVRCDLVESLPLEERMQFHQWLHDRSHSLEQQADMALFEGVRVMGLQGMVVLPGHASKMLLHDLPALHVRLVAPLSFRIKTRVALTGETAAQAEAVITDRDENERQEVYRLLGHDVDDPMLYHLVINRAVMDMDPTVQTIRRALYAIH